jgi:hypothetical protein
VPCPGDQFETFKQRIYDAARAGDPAIEASKEVHQNFTARGTEERERLVLSTGKATLHVHVYPFARDAFVGWTNHLNRQQWKEGQVVSRAVRDKRAVQFETLAVGNESLTEFDLIDADVLAETVHGRIVHAIKTFLKEREIEADLDFTIIRGTRDDSLSGSKDQSAEPKRKRFLGQ